MNIPEIEKNIEINKRKFTIKKMDAKKSSYILFRLMKILTPIFNNINTNQKEDFKIEDLNLNELAESLFSLSEEEFQSIQESALKVVYENLNAGRTPILNENGSWGVNDIEYDGALVMNLTIQSLVFSLKGFFSGNLFQFLNKK
jgi:hypothetical protein